MPVWTPYDAEAWEWDEGNEAELARHGLLVQEVYEAWENGPLFVPNVKYKAGDWKMLGLTNGGRKLTIIVRFFEERLVNRAITGWDSTEGERKKYL